MCRAVSAVPSLVVVLWLAVGTPSVSATFSESFRDFLVTTYGAEKAAVLIRTDLGEDGSFGGGNHSTVTNRPIIFVHGITMNAGKMVKVRDYFAFKGYEDNELYGTTYGPTSMLNNSGAAHCEYTKLVRSLINAVLAYTKSDSMNVISYSMGVIIARKAILGGDCVDTGESLGEALTSSIHTFIGISGPNHGAITCHMGKVIKVGACNSLNGMSCGSTFLNDINLERHYEGSNVFVIQTIPDLIVGNLVCDDKFTTRIDGSNGTTTKYGQTHMTVYFLSAPDQYDLITKND